jgi:hypothetical protein
MKLCGVPAKLSPHRATSSSKLVFHETSFALARISAQSGSTRRARVRRSRIATIAHAARLLLQYGISGLRLSSLPTVSWVSLPKETFSDNRYADTDNARVQ